MLTRAVVTVLQTTSTELNATTKVETICRASCLSRYRTAQVFSLCAHWHFSAPMDIFNIMDFTGTYRCAFCGEENEVFVEPEGGEEQTLTEDCSICCRPNVLTIRIINNQIMINSEFEG